MTRKTILLAATGIFVFCAVYGIAVYSASGSWQIAANIGASFAGVTAVFSGLAFVCLIGQLWLQQQELQQLREEMRDQRQALCDSAEATALAAQLNAHLENARVERAAGGGGMSGKATSVVQERLDKVIDRVHMNGRNS